MNCGLSESKYPFIWFELPDPFRGGMNKGQKKKSLKKRSDIADVGTPQKTGNAMVQWKTVPMGEGQVGQTTCLGSGD